MKHLIRFLKGIVIGAAMVVPGVSGGTMAIVLGLYDDILHSISSVLKEFKKSFIFLFATGLGGIVGLLAFSKIMEAVKSFFELPMIFLFMGVILGGLPVLFSKAVSKPAGAENNAKATEGSDMPVETAKEPVTDEEANEKTKDIKTTIKTENAEDKDRITKKPNGINSTVDSAKKPSPLAFLSKPLFNNKLKISAADVLFFVIGAVIILLLGRDTSAAAGAVEAEGFKGVVIVFVGGVILAAALVLPGISGSYMLLIFGVYDITLNAINTVNIPFLVPLAFGVIAGTVASTFLIEKLLNRFARPSYMVILGFVAASLVTVFPGLPKGLEWISCILTFIIGCAAMLILTYAEKKKDKAALKTA